MQSGTKLCLSATLGILGGIIAIIGFSFLHFYPVIFDEILIKQTRLVKGSLGYDNWKNPPADIFIDFYVWHLENPLEVEKGAKPKITQKGPYTYRENRTKDFVENHGNGTLSYIQPESFVYDPVHSVGDPMVDTFTTLNMPLLTLIDQLQYMNRTTQYAFDIFATLVEKHIHVTKTVHEFIWGYFSPLLFFAKLIEPKMVPTVKFGIYTDRNHSNDGVYTVDNGVENYTRTNTIIRWKGQESLHYWTTKYGNMINGTDGSYFGQFMSQEDRVYIFVSDLCRSLYATKKPGEQVREVHDIPTWRYTVPPEVFANHYKNPDNIAFCTPDKDHCLPGGLLNVSLCQFGAPIFVSWPHFLHADPEVSEMIDGVHPKEELHETFLDIEPYTGAPLNLSKRSQINAHLRKYDFIEFYKKVPEAYVPLVWIQERMVINADAANDLKQQLVLPLAVGKYMPWAVGALGLTLLLSGVVCLGYHWKKRASAGDSFAFGSVMKNDDDDIAPLIN